VPIQFQDVPIDFKVMGLQQFKMSIPFEFTKQDKSLLGTHEVSLQFYEGDREQPLGPSFKVVMEVT
jgi:hypothetical protein